MFKRGAYWYAWNPITGKKETTGESDRHKAEAVVVGWRAKAKDPTHRDATSKTLADGYELILTVKRRAGRAKDTIEMYEQKLRQFTRVVGGEHVPLQRLMDANVIDDFVTKREREGVVPNTIYKELVAIRQLLEHSKRKGWVSGDVDAVMPIGYSPQYKPVETFIPYERWWDYVHAFPDHRAAEIAFHLGTGANENEVRRAMRSFVRDKEVFIDGTKRATRKRHVPLTRLTRPFVEFALEHAPSGDDTRPLFDHWASKARDMHEAAARAGLARYVDQAGRPLPEKLESGAVVGRVLRNKLFAGHRLIGGITSNDLRRSFGSVLAQQDVPFEIIAQCMGNSVAVVAKVYAKFRPTDVRRAVHRYIPDEEDE